MVVSTLSESTIRVQWLLVLPALVLLTLLVNHPAMRSAGFAGQPVIELLRGLLLGGWIVLILWSAWWLTCPVPLLARWSLRAVLGLLLVGLLSPPEVLQAVKDRLVLLLSSGPLIEGGPDADALGHFGLFAGLAALLCLTRADLGRPRLLGLLAALAVATELMQLFVEGRQPDWRDVLVDLAGAAAGALLAGAIRWRHRVTA